jgi:hypothetical protein
MMKRMNKDDIQKNWFDLIDKTGPTEYQTSREQDKPARYDLARRLRDMADQIERGTDPSVYGFYEMKHEPSIHGFISPLWELKVVLSYPWGG